MFAYIFSRISPNVTIFSNTEKTVLSWYVQIFVVISSMCFKPQGYKLNWSSSNYWYQLPLVFFFKLGGRTWEKSTVAYDKIERNHLCFDANNTGIYFSASNFQVSSGSVNGLEPNSRQVIVVTSYNQTSWFITAPLSYMICLLSQQTMARPGHKDLQICPLNSAYISLSSTIWTNSLSLTYIWITYQHIIPQWCNKAWVTFVIIE